MRNDSGYSANASPLNKPLWRRILGWPSTQHGWWSVGLTMGFFVFFTLFQILVASGQRGGETFFSNPWLALSILTAASLAIAGGVTAVIAIFWKRERSFFSFFALLLGFFVAVFILGEIALPH